MKNHNHIFKAAEMYMRVRKNDIHIPLSYHYALQLLNHYPEADAELAAVAIILHDIGWYSIDEDDIFKKGFQSENFMQSDVRFLHESEGVRLAIPLLQSLGYDSVFIEKVTTIIDGHDTRDYAKSLEDEIVRDADKLWRFGLAGVSVVCDWFKMNPTQYINRLEIAVLPLLHRPESLAMAKADLLESKRLLCCDAI